MTRRLYYDDAYTTSFEAQVVAWHVEEPGRLHVELEETYFYPTSGGQLFDRGTLAGHPVVDVTEDGERILHVVEAGDFPNPPATVKGVVDPDRRRHHRQQHTGQHVLSRVLEDRQGLTTLSCRLGETGNTLDVSREDLSLEELEGIEDEVNRYLWSGHAVRVRYLDRDEVDTAELRKMPKGHDRLRVIEVGGLDRCACGGTHVGHVGEVGLVVFTRVERFKGGSRLHFLCGDRARQYLRERDRLVRRLMALLTTGPEALESATRRLLEDARSTGKQTAALMEELMVHEARTWLPSAVTLADKDPALRWLGRVVPPERAAGLSRAASTLAQEPDMAVALAAEADGRCQLVVARSKNVDLDCGRWLRETLVPLGGKGGGRPEHARGGVSGVTASEVLEALKRALPQSAP